MAALRAIVCAAAGAAGVMLAVSACSGSDKAVDSEPVPTAAASSTSSSVEAPTPTTQPTTSQQTTTTSQQTTTTTAPMASTSTSTTSAAPAPLTAAEITSHPEGATGTITSASGDVTEIVTPWQGRIREGTAILDLNADGYEPKSLELRVEAESSYTVWLDKEGQLLSTIASFATEGAPKQVAFTPDNSELWVTLLNGDGVEVFDPVTGAELAEIDLPSGGSVEVIFNEAGTLAYVSQMQTSSVYEIDVASKQTVRNLDTKSAWTKVMALSPDERTLYASNWSGNNVTEFDLETGDVVRQIPTVRTPRGLYVTPDGEELWVAGFANGEIQVIDLATGGGDVIHRSGGSMRHIVGDAETGRVYASDMARAHVLVVDRETREVVELAKVDRVPNTIDLSPDGRVLYVSSRGRNNPTSYHLPGPEWGAVAVIDAMTGEYLDAIVGGNQPTGLDVSPDGSLLARSDFLDSRVTTHEIPAYEVYQSGEGGRWEAHLTEIRK